MWMGVPLSPGDGLSVEALELQFFISERVNQDRSLSFAHARGEASS
jgi:hypothetical protein